MARSKKGSRDTSGRGGAASSRPSKKRLRLKTSDDEEEEEVEVAKEERGDGGAVRRRRGGGEIDSLGKKILRRSSHSIGGEGLEEEGNCSRRGSIRGAAGCSRGGADPRVRSLEEVLFLCLTLADRCLHSSTYEPVRQPSNTMSYNVPSLQPGEKNQTAAAESGGGQAKSRGEAGRQKTDHQVRKEKQG